VLTEFLSELVDFVDLDYVIATLGPGILLIFKNRNVTSERTLLLRYKDQLTGVLYRANFCLF